MTTEATRCSTRSLGLEEPQFATASVVRSWLLLECPGPWGYDALIQNRATRSVAAALRARARSLGIRLVLLRRPAGRTAPGAHAFFATTGHDGGRLEHLHLADGPAGLLDLDWGAPAAGGPTGLGDVETEPLFLVCTNGARDACCAERGRPVARALAAGRGERVWECSHIGGDRFAGNLVCFPAGVYFGRVGPGEAPGVAEGFANGRLDLAHYRGRSGLDFATQAAEHFLRVRHDLTGLSEVTLVARSRPSAGVAQAVFATPLGLRRVSVGVGRADTPRRLTCRGVEEARPPVFELLAVEEVAPT